MTKWKNRKKLEWGKYFQTTVYVHKQNQYLWFYAAKEVKIL